jgi:hypothetical protein
VRQNEDPPSTSVVYRRPAKNGPVDGWWPKLNSALEDGQGGRAEQTQMTWDRLRSVRFREGGIMGKKDVPIIRPKRTWGKEQWDHYNRMPWVARRLADLMVLVPGFSGWLMRRASRLEEKPPKRIDRKGPRDMTRMSAKSIPVGRHAVPATDR